FLLVLSIRFLRGASPLRAGRPRSDPRVVLPFGLGVGVLGAFLGIGGGIVMVLFMTIYMGFDIRRAIGTSTVVIIVNALAGTAQYLHQGIPDVPAGIAVGIAGALTATFGARATIRIPRATLRRIFGVFLLVVALRFLGVYSAAASLL
ncbi:MAG TPA: sulfite exporter TauE/SafE family protein, partial [Thermoplasmata archaeon]|nr:sulfite exporter TauE/SafE family protein [Thermoplasmata archaeon]